MVSKCKKGTILTFRAIQPNPSYDMLFMPKKLHAKKKKVTEAFLRLALPLLKVDADDGQVGI